MLLGSTPYASTPMASDNFSQLSSAVAPSISVLKDAARTVYLVEFAAKQNSFVPPPFDKPEPIAGMPVAAAAPTAFVGFNAPETTFRFTDIPYYPSPQDTQRPNLIPYSALLNPGDIERSISVAIEDQGRGQTSFGEFQIANADGRFDTIFDNYNPDQRTVRTYVTPKWGDSSEAFQVGAAVCSRWYKTREKIIVPVQAVAVGLDSNFSIGVYDGRGDLGGDAGLAGRNRPFALGINIFNITPILINLEFYIYQVSGTQIISVKNVKDAGLPLSASVGDFIDYYDLRDAVIPPGAYATCLRLGLFRANWAGGSPGGVVTCDVDGVIHNTTFLASTGEFVEYVMTVVSGLPDSRLDLNTVRALPPGQIAFYYDGGTNITIEDMINDVLKPINGFFYIDRQNKFVFKTHRDPDLVPPTITLKHGLGTTNDIISMQQEQGDIDPIFSLQYTYSRNWTIMTEDQLSPFLSSAEKTALKAEFKTATLSDVSLQLTDASAKAISVPSFFNNKQDALNIAAQQLLVRGKRKEKHVVQVKLIGLNINPGDVIKIIHPRFCPNGKNFIVYRTVDRLDQNLVELGVFG